MLVFFFFRAGRLYIAWRIPCSLGVSQKGVTPLFGLDGNVPLSRALFFRVFGPESFKRMGRLDISCLHL